MFDVNALCQHGVPRNQICPSCEFEQEQADLEAMRADPYECMPFGDAIRWEEEQIASEREDDYRDYETDFPYPEEPMGNE